MKRMTNHHFLIPSSIRYLSRLMNQCVHLMMTMTHSWMMMLALAFQTRLQKCPLNVSTASCAVANDDIIDAIVAAHTSALSKASMAIL